MPSASPVPQEIELKLRFDARDERRLAARLQRLGKAARLSLDNVYHDTPDGLLARHRMALRLRVEQPLDAAGAPAGPPVVLQTLKTQRDDDPLGARGEWERPVAGDALDLDALRDTPLAALLAAHPGATLGPVLRTLFVRQRRRVRRGAARLEVALDLGEITAMTGERGFRTPIRELEIEVLQGPPHAAVALARALLAARAGGTPDLALLPDAESKAARGERLKRGAGRAPVAAQAAGFAEALATEWAAASDAPFEASPPGVPSGPSGSPPAAPAEPGTVGPDAAAALRSVLAHGIARLLDNVHALRDGDDPEAIHQARVALRRMRAALRLLRDETAPPPAVLVDALRRYGRLLGRARDADVLADRLAEGTPAPPAALRTALGRQRMLARAAARRAVGQPAFAALVLGLLDWCHRPSRRAGVPLADHAPRLLRRARRKVLRRAEGFDRLAPAARHRVRIAAKQLRYAVELLAPLIDPARRDRQQRRRRAAEQLQAALGTLNDAATARRVLVRAGASARWLAARERAEQPANETALKQARRALRTLARRKAR